MKPITYKITRGERGYPEQFHDVKGFVMFELYGYQWAGHMEATEEGDGDFDQWIVSEVSTGCSLASGKIFFTAEEAKEWAWKYLLDKGDAMTRFHVEKARMKIQQYETIRNSAHGSEPNRQEPKEKAL